MLFLVLISGISAAVSACGFADAGDRALEVDVAYDTIADTVFVYTRSGQSWAGNATLVPEVVIGELEGPEEYIFGRIVSLAVGPAGEIFVMDRQVPALRVYEPTGTYRTTFGRDGSGPGEYKQPDGGMAVIGDRLVLRDPGNGRFTVYDMDGELVGTWLVSGVFNSSDQMAWDNEGNAYTSAAKDTSAPVSEWVSILVRYDSNGMVTDLLDIPLADIPEGAVEGSTENPPVVEETNPDFDPAEEGSLLTRWRTSTVYDVFETNGTYLGSVTTPDNFRADPQPVFGPDWVVATTRDELGVQRVVRYRIDIAGRIRN